MQVKYKGVWKIGVFRPISRFISKTVQGTAIVTMEDEQELVFCLSSGAISNGLQWPLT